MIPDDRRFITDEFANVPLVSVIIPTNRPWAVIEPCLRALAQPSDDKHEMEVLLVYNGAPPPQDVLTQDWPFSLRVGYLAAPNIGAAKNWALDRAQGAWILLLNDDVLPMPGFISAHLEAHRRVARPAMVLGQSPWRSYPDETVFDRMIQTTSMVFFYDQLRPHEWCNYRHAWNLNLSIPRAVLGDRRFDEALGPFFFEDLELAWRLEIESGVRVYYAPEAGAVHDHRYTFDGYFQREFALGEAAVRLWDANRDCFRSTYGADLDETFLDYARRYVAVEGRREEQLRRRLAAIAGRPLTDLADSADVRDEIVQALYVAHLPLKRLAFRRGLLAAAERAAVDSAQHAVTLR